MKTQVIKFKDGMAETLRGGFLDLRKMGDITVRRSSEIEFDEGSQMHYIRLLEPALLHLNDKLRKLFFPTYEAAVEHEVALLNNMRKTTSF